MVTLWILIIGFKNVGGMVTLNTTGSQPILQPIATYRSAAECNSAAKQLYEGTQNAFSADVVCIPTGISDPVGVRSVNAK